MPRQKATHHHRFHPSSPPTRPPGTRWLGSCARLLSPQLGPAQPEPQPASLCHRGKTAPLRGACTSGRARHVPGGRTNSSSPSLAPNTSVGRGPTPLANSHPYALTCGGVRVLKVFLPPPLLRRCDSSSRSTSTSDIDEKVRLEQDEPAVLLAVFRTSPCEPTGAAALLPSQAFKTQDGTEASAICADGT